MYARLCTNKRERDEREKESESEKRRHQESESEIRERTKVGEERELTQELKELKEQVMLDVHQKRLRPGTVGATPIHTAFLLEEHELGRDMVQSAALREAFVDSLLDAFIKARVRSACICS
jgi:hypothetical protein